MTAPPRALLALATLFGVAAMLVWSTWLGIHAMGGMVVHTPYAVPPHLWHAHEMVFGYGGAVLAGVVLATAPARVGRGAMALVGAVWLAGRGVMWLSASLDPGLVAAVDLAFGPLVLLLLVPIAGAASPRRWVMPGLAVMAWAGNLAMHLDGLGHGGPGTGAGLRAGLLALCAALAVSAMRAGPAGSATVPPRGPVRRLDAVLTAGALVLPLLLLLSFPDAVLGRVAVMTGSGHLLWLAISRGAAARPTLAAFGMGLCIWGLALLGAGSKVAGLHVLAVGVVGSGALSAIRALAGGVSVHDAVARETLGWAGGLMLLSVLLRWGASSLGIGLYFPLMLASGAAWVVAMTVALVALWPPRLGARPRAEREPPAAAPCGKVAPRMRHYRTP